MINRIKIILIFLIIIILSGCSNHSAKTIYDKTQEYLEKSNYQGIAELLNELDTKEDYASIRLTLDYLTDIGEYQNVKKLLLSNIIGVYEGDLFKDYANNEEFNTNVLVMYNTLIEQENYIDAFTLYSDERLKNINLEKINFLKKFGYVDKMYNYISKFVKDDSKRLQYYCLGFNDILEDGIPEIYLFAPEAGVGDGYIFVYDESNDQCMSYWVATGKYSSVTLIGNDLDTSYFFSGNTNYSLHNIQNKDGEYSISTLLEYNEKLDRDVRSFEISKNGESQSITAMEYEKELRRIEQLQNEKSVDLSLTYDEYSDKKLKSILERIEDNYNE